MKGFFSIVSDFVLENDDKNRSKSEARYILSVAITLMLACVNTLLHFFEKTSAFDTSAPGAWVADRRILLIIAAAELFTSCFCFSKAAIRSTPGRESDLGTSKAALLLVTWLTWSFLCYSAISRWQGVRHPLLFLFCMIKLWKMSPLVVDLMITTTIVYFLGGSVFLLSFPRQKTSSVIPKAKELKIHCPNCAGKTSFGKQWLGRTIDCPHCGQPLLLSEKGATIQTE